MKYFLLVTTLFASITVQFGQNPVPAPAQKTAILIMGATAHLGNGMVIPNSIIAFDSGKLTVVVDGTTARIDRTKYGKIYDATGKHVYPGFIATNSRIGLVEIEAVRSTVDFADVGSMNPNLRAIVAYNTDSDVSPTIRANGVLLAQIAPGGGTLSGTSSVVQLDAWNWEDAAYRIDDGLHLNWPTPRPPGNRDAVNPAEPRPADPYVKNMQDLRRFFDEARAYVQQEKPETVNLKFEAMRGLFTQKQTLFIHVSTAKTMQESVLFGEQYGMRVVLVGASESWLIADFLKQHNIPVMLEKPQRLPDRDDENIDQPYHTAAVLQEKGVLFAFMEDGGWKQRNLPFQAGQAVGFGLPYEAAVSALTLNTAKILQIDQRTGSLESGKDATLFISEGDALDMRTCIITAAFIQGREIVLDNKQKQLYQRFGEKYKQ